MTFVLSDLSTDFAETLLPCLNLKSKLLTDAPAQMSPKLEEVTCDEDFDEIWPVLFDAYADPALPRIGSKLRMEIPWP